jgi:iron complex transport system ATP-binding protein
MKGIDEMDCHIRIDNLSFGYGNRKVLDDISLCISEGSFTSIIGPNGSGKSTLLKVITSMLKPQEGIISLLDRDIRTMNRKEIAAKVAVVPQNTSIEFDFRVMDVVMMGRYPFINKLKGETQEDIEIAINYMKYTNTLHLADRSFMELSGGERQRVILAQALTQKPQILVLDEPVSHLDLQYQVEILNLIRKMCVDNKLTVIAVLHDLNMASTYSDKVFMLKEGKVRYSGSPLEAFTVSSIKDIFNTDVYISVGEIGNKPYIYTLTKPHIQSKNKRIHVICGGGSGSDVIKELYFDGYDLSSGVIAVGDQDWKTSKEYELDVAEEIPFVGISDKAYSINKSLILKADFILLTDLYFGKANIRNLELLLDEDIKQKTLYVIDDNTFESRDYTQGYASELYNKIKSKLEVRLIQKKELLKELARQELNYED